MEEHSYSDPVEFSKFSRRRRCCGQRVQLALLGLATVLLWAGLLVLLLFWHWDTVQNLRQLEVTAAQNVSRVSKDLERHNGDQMAQKSQAAQVSQNMEEIRAEQKRMKAQDSELSRNLDGLRLDLSNLKSLSLNERHTALRSLERLQQEVLKLWIELHVSNARTPGVTPGETLPPTLPIIPTVPVMAPATTLTTVPATTPTTVPAMTPTTVPATAPTTVPATTPTMVPATTPTTVPATAPTTVPATASTTVPVMATTTASATVPVMAPATASATVPTTAAPLSLSSTPGSTCNTCPEKWVSFQRKCYYFGEDPKRWIQARFACSKLQGQLVSIHSQEEQACPAPQDFLARHANRKGTWIGLRDLDREGEFIWMDKEPLNYSNWRPGEPNNGGQGEDCVMMQGSGQWNDAFCGSRLDGWVCDRLATC
ncbi:low affinity immunoglobulin epsilon Fc receptor isoform X2 [Lutra lutra]|uniref:low affinity immunoglobulin epsilon Fc receptor isoform X2 n=1 Tax=Lutra lutra TaxID=9657 RepID=UPI001FD2483D|nr:low affinity immunoglobulin epsilon Fc receptor isoform X2 [Lutra lutra]XP_047560168.1 low affinity immunoglobulin epsilon Fc receptor isoform X2 [Lutra lutra]XP_047560179.1 low affinity immunoglobulin epsilon Fc receptor isoform X2 [Lutra lutra]